MNKKKSHEQDKQQFKPIKLFGTFIDMQRPWTPTLITEAHYILIMYNSYTTHCIVRQMTI